MIYWGIDAGLTGAIACFHNFGDLLVLPMPRTEKDLNVSVIRNWLCKLIDCDNALNYKSVAYIEGVNAFKGQGVTSSFRFGFVTGKIEGIFQTLGIELHRVYPVKWKNAILGKGKHTKEDSIQYCLEHYPNTSLLRTAQSKVSDHNIADAICIAEYARKFHGTK
jgi:Holliday junction resolvasome RuvABC endonuclease subunit